MYPEDVMSTEIRPAINADTESLIFMAKACGKREDHDYFQRCFELQHDGDRQLYIISADGQDCGYGILNFNPQYGPYERVGIPAIQDVNIIPEKRQQGLATGLIHFCEKKVRQDGYEEIGISVGLSAQYGPAQRLYTKLGYLPDGQGVTYERKTVVHGEMWPVDDDLCLMMVKEL